ncbi:hypothetical protein [Olivibacter jilunii]|uniref:hypothetical protein n=1 Tax=Olivibacter jilunii TaxID=985016 RepID=UPI0010301577|nr:hypothetical protein [Olivibacter jilunii]
MEIATEKLTTLDQLDTKLLALKREGEIIHHHLTGVLATRIIRERRKYLLHFLPPLQDLRSLPSLTGHQDLQLSSDARPRKLTTAFFELKMLSLGRALEELEKQITLFEKRVKSNPGLLEPLQPEMNWNDWRLRFLTVICKIKALGLG